MPCRYASSRRSSSSPRPSGAGCPRPALEERLTALPRSGEIGEYNRVARDHNDAVNAYNLLLDEATAAVDLHNSLAGNAHDRPERRYHREGVTRSPLP